MATQTLPEVPPGIQDLLTTKERAILYTALTVYEMTLDRRQAKEPVQAIKEHLRSELDALRDLSSKLRS